MASAGTNNNLHAGHAAGTGAEGADPAAEFRLVPLHRLAGTSVGFEQSGAAVSINVEASMLPNQPGAAAAWPVAFGTMALAGRLSVMEDTVSLHPSFCVWAHGEPMHFLAVFDGHGGPNVAALCREQMHAILAEELAIAAEQYLAHRDEDGAEERAWRAALSRSFARVDALAPAACACGRVGWCACPLSSRPRSPIVGSTAVVALLVRDRVIVANCGDSRAVLCRGARAVPLSMDHKPDRPDERARIEAVGGQVVFLDGPRVGGILAMSRAIGHEILKPEVICEPKIMITIRSDDDDFLILASDGLWDVISNKMACDVAMECKKYGSPTSFRAVGSGQADHNIDYGTLVRQQLEPRCYEAATLLGRLALSRQSSDNISMVVIDLKVRV
uniref:Uncharacterized protein n=1 Tax=Avena sativa TaxID=4498 RepID=A0ACD5V837_AVESA